MPADHEKVISRFAPSPTGELHIGGARTALYAWALARASGHPDSKFLLRFEDTDLARSSDASAKRILDDLNWLGIVPDNYDPALGLDSIPRQSKQHAAGRYNEVIQQLLDAGHAYRDGDSDDDPIRFKFGYAIDYADAVYGPITSPAEANEDFIIRKGKAGGFMPTFHLAVVVDDLDMHVTHVLRGQEHLTNTAKHAALLDALGWQRPAWAHTPSIMNPGGSKMSKRDKAKAIEKAQVASGKTKEEIAEEVTKTQDILGRMLFPTIEKSTTGLKLGIGPDTKPERVKTPSNRHQLYGRGEILAVLDGSSHDALAQKYVSYHLNIALPEVAVSDFCERGYLPAALLNYLALLGWNPGNDLEQFDLDYLGQHFSLKRINKANSTFDRAKLASFNQDAILALPPDVWEAKLREHFTTYHPEFIEKLGDGFDVFAAAYRERSKTLNDPATQGRFFVEAPNEYNDKAVKKNLTKNDGEGLKTLAALRDKFPGVNPWDAPTIRETLEAAWQDLGCKNMGGVAQPLRVALTGTAVSPEIDATLALLGKDETLQRIDACLAAHQSAPA